MARMQCAFCFLSLSILLLQLLVLCVFLPQTSTSPDHGDMRQGDLRPDFSRDVDSLPWEYDMIEDEATNPWEYDMIEDEATSILPWELDVLLTDVNAPLLGGSVSLILGIEYLAPWPFNGSFVWPLRGVIHGRNSRFMVSAATSLSPEKAQANEVDSKAIAVHYVVDTASPYTYLSEDAVKRLADQKFYYDSYDTLPVHIHGVPIEVHVSPFKSHFKEVSLLGADFMKAIQGEIHAYYGGKKSFSIVRGSSPTLLTG